MAAGRQGKPDPFKRHSTRYRGISYRERADGSRSYYVYAQGRHQLVDGGEREALLVQADLRGKAGRGLRVTPVETTFAELAEEWFSLRSPGWRPSTRGGYRITLDKHLLPRLGQLKLAAITPDRIARLVAEREQEGASGAYIALNLRPLNGVMKLALRRGLIVANPVSALLPEERPKPVKRKRRTWTPEMIARLLAAARERGARPGNVYDYTPIITVAVYTGMRIGELLGLRWQNVDLKTATIHVRHQLSRTTRSLRRRPKPACETFRSHRRSSRSCAATGSPPATHKTSTSSSVRRPAARSRIETSPGAASRGQPQQQA